MGLYIHEDKLWPAFEWDYETIWPHLSAVRHKQGVIQGHLALMGFAHTAQVNAQALVQEVIKSNEIEGKILNPDQVRSSVARHLGLDYAGLPAADRHIEGIVEMMLDATQNYFKPLSKERLCGWQAALFPTGYSGAYKIAVGRWRDNKKGPMQVVSGPLGRERVHFDAPEADRVEHEMQAFIKWFNKSDNIEPVLKSAVAHLWFLTIHPFDDGNGRVARAIADMQLARAEETPQRFCSMSAQIRLERSTYYKLLESTQRGTLDITGWLTWYLQCLYRSLSVSTDPFARVLQKNRYWEKHAHTIVNERQRLMVNKLWDNFTGKLTTGKWAKMARCSPDTALRDISDLLQKDMLAKEPGGGRSTSYVLNFNL